MSNIAFNNTAFTVRTIPPMQEELHESVERLYAAAKELAGVEGKSAVARLLNESPQAVNNWERRGISEGGALKAQAAFGCDANWVLTGNGGMTLGWPFPRVRLQAFLALEVDDRAYVEGVLANAIEGLGGDPNPSDVQRFTAAHRTNEKRPSKRKAA
jgi:hypothetical protein